MLQSSLQSIQAVGTNYTLIEEMYKCENLEECLIKYVIGGVSLIFVVLYALAIFRIRRKKTLDLDVKDQILLSIALIESVFILLYHILIEHNIFLFVIRVAKMLE